MARPRHYSPQLSRFTVSALYHEARARKVPMTQLADQLLRKTLMESDGWKTAEALRVAEDTATKPPAPKAA